MPYSRPPITEAVVEFRTVNQIDQGTIERLGRKLSSVYPNSNTETLTEFEVNANENKAKVKPPEWLGLKLTSSDQADILTLRKDICGCIRLAPYIGWEAFSAKVKDAWSVWRKETGPLPLSRIGVRYVNRIDVPAASGLIQVEDYLNLWPRSPDRFKLPMTSYAIQVSRPFGADNCNLLISSSNVASPLIGYVSFALDIDLSVEASADNPIPLRENDLWDLIGRMRDHKNSVFEACITDQARGLFNT